MAICRWHKKSDKYIYQSEDGTVDFCGEENGYEITYEDALARLGAESEYQIFGDVVITRLANLHAYGSYD